MNIPRIVALGVAATALTVMALVGGRAAEEKAASPGKAVTADKGTAPDKSASAAADKAAVVKSAPPDKSAASDKAAVSTEAKYAVIPERNIFYPRREGAASGEAGANPGGSGLLLTGVVEAGDARLVVIQNTGTGEASIVAVGEPSGAGQVVDATLDGITLSTEAGTFRVAVGSYLSGAKGPDIAPASNGMSAGSGAGGGDLPTGAPNAGGNGGRPGGFRGRPGAEQMESFRNMTPEQRENLRQSFRQRRGRRPDNTEGNQ